MATQNSSNQQYSNDADGFSLSGGTTKRKLSVTGSDIKFIGSATVSITLPSSDSTLMVTSAIDTDNTLTANSDTKIASQKATKTYVDTKDAQNVKLTGNQTVAGQKTMTDAFNVTNVMTVDNGLGSASFTGYLGGFLLLKKASGDAQPAAQLYAGDQSLRFGPGGSTSLDTTIKRTGANQLDFGGAKIQKANVQPRTNTVASSATPAINTDTTDIFTITALAANITSMTSSLTGTPVNGQKLLIRIKDNGTARTITWGASFVSSGTATLLATTVISKTHMVGLIYDSTASKWVCMACDSSGY